MRWKFHLYYVVTGETRAIPFLMYLWKLLQKLSLVVAIGMTTSNKYKTNLKKGKSKSLFKLNEIKDDDDVMKGSFNGLRRGSSQTLKLGACNVKSFFSEAANKMSLQLPTHKNLIQKLFPADFSSRPETVKHEDFNEGWCELDCMLCTVVTYGFTHVLHSVGASVHPRVQAEGLGPGVLPHGYRGVRDRVHVLLRPRHRAAPAPQVRHASDVWRWNGK